MATFTAYRVELNGDLSHKEHLDNWQEVLEYGARMAKNGFGHLLIVRDHDQEIRHALLNGDDSYDFA